MRPWELPIIPLACAVSGAAWATVAARRSGESTALAAARALLGGAAAFGIAYASYDLLSLSGWQIRWERLLRGDLGALGVAAAIGVVEEGAKLAGILLVLRARPTTAAVLAAAVGVSAGFAALEALLVLGGTAPTPATLARVALGPVAHAILAVPLAFGVAAATRGTRRGWLVVAPALAAAAALHAGADLSLALPQLGRAAHASVLLGPALWVFARARRPARQAARVGS
jgi:RsiW-degrading membrane proteinase PrsW (M82 family)